MDLRNQKVVVVGLGESGYDACLLLDKLGAIVSVTDGNDNKEIRERIEKLRGLYIEAEIGRHTEAFLKGCDLVVVSPGVAKSALPIKFALGNDTPIISELELGFNFTPGPIIAITGTNGKSTVVSLVGEVLKKAGKKVVVCGNIGNSLSGEVLHMSKDTICVLEVSSFQLEWIVDFRPAISCILNITEDHLDRYKDFSEYIDTKFRIFANQKERDVAILNYDDHKLRDVKPPFPITKLFYSRNSKIEGIFYENGDIIFNLKDKREGIFTLPYLNLKGDHNLENILAVILITLLQGVEPKIIERAIKEFRPLSHRIENVGEIEGIEFFDDSKGTNVDATKRALQSIDKNIILIAGGRDKNGNYEAIKDEVQAKVKKLILIGEAAPLIEKVFQGMVKIEKSSSLEDATLKAYSFAKKGDAVLLSPMCSSFDMFLDYKHRGEVFRGAVETLKLKAQSPKPKAQSPKL